MPSLFRVLGGSVNNNSSSGNNGNSRSSSGSNQRNSRSSNNNSNRSRGVSSTYPGLRLAQQRASAASNGTLSGSLSASGVGSTSNSFNNNNNGGTRTGSSSSIGWMSAVNTSVSSYPHHYRSSRTDPYVSTPPQHERNQARQQQQPQMVIRGAPPSASSMSSTNSNQRVSSTSMPSLPPRSNVASTSYPSPTTPYVDNTARNTNGPNATTSSPGAYSVTRSSPTGSSQVYRVQVPPGVVPGSEFTVHAGNRRVRVRCPLASRPGQPLQITLPPEPVTTHKHLSPAPLTRACGTADEDFNDPFLRLDDSIGTGGAVTMSPEVVEVNRAATSTGGTARTYLVTIPPNVYPGMKFTATADGQRFEVTCPNNAGPNTKVRIVAPAANTKSNNDDPASPEEDQPEPMAAPKMQVYEVVVPNGVRPNQPFTLMANGQRVLVTCPPNVYSGQKIRFQLPVPSASDSKRQKPKIRLSYKDESGSSGWERTIRVTDMKFQWIRVTDQDESMKKKVDNTDSGNVTGAESMRATGVECMEGFDFDKVAYVRKIQYLEGNDARMRTGSVALVPAQEAVVDSKLVDKNYHGTNQTKTLLQYKDVANIQCKSLDEKVEWFRQHVCEELYMPWEKGHVKIVVRRHALLEDSVSAILSLGRDDMRKRWRIEFAGEPGIEAGGLTREWFQLVTEQIFDPDFGLWLSSGNNQMAMMINPASHISCPDDYLKFFRFLGRVMGRALFDGQLIKGHMVRPLYKHLLGWPITFEDLEAQDEEYYTSLKKFTTMEDLTMMCLDFTVTEETLGVRKDIELVPGGTMKEVTSDNLSQYLEANLKYRMLNRCKPQITEIMLGFFDIIPEAALTVFDPNELELILCGLPTIDMDDWMTNTKYSGYYESKGRRHPVIEWFWEVVRDDFDAEMKARLLQFVTGTSGVPPRGFAVLQGNDGNIKKFCVHGVSRDQYVYPRAHTCFNRIDLPNYSSKRELREKLGQAVSMTYVGFDIE